LTANPISSNFGPASVGQRTGENEFQFINETAAPISFYSAALVGANSADFSMGYNGCFAIGIIWPGNRCSVYIAFSPTQLGPLSAAIQVETDQGSESAALLGLGASGSLSGSTPAFPSQPFYNGTQYANARFDNLDPSYTVISGAATITGPDADLFSINYNGCQGNTQWPGSSCDIGITFNPTEPVTAVAQLNLFNNGSPNPATIPLTATALAGAKLAVNPIGIDFGGIEIGKESSSREILLENVGDAPAQIQQIFVLGASNFFEIEDNLCDGAILNPGQSCSLQVKFVPGANGTGSQNGNAFVIANIPEPITQVAMAGRGYLPLRGLATVIGRTEATQRVFCQASGFPAETRLDYRWMIAGKVVGFRKSFLIQNRQVGRSIRCQIYASNPASSIQTESALRKIVPANLSRIPGSFVNSQVCRVIQSKVLRYPSQISPAAPARLPGVASIFIDGKRVVSGKNPQVSPRLLERFSNGAHILTIRRGSSISSSKLSLSNCSIAAEASALGRITRIKVAAIAGADNVSFTLPASASANLKNFRGQIVYQAQGYSSATFVFSGRRTSRNQVQVILRGRTITVENLPDNVGVVRIQFPRRYLSRGSIQIAANVKGAGRLKLQARISR